MQQSDVQDSSPMRSPVSLLLTGVALLVLLVIGWRTITQPDYWLHLATGREVISEGIPRADTFSFSAEGESWVASAWLYDVIVYGVQGAFGHGAVSCLHMLAVLAAFLLLLPTARRLGGPWSAPLALLLSSWLLAPDFEVGSTRFALLFPALFIFLLERRPDRRVLWTGLLVLQVVWTNMHASFLFGPLIAALFAFDDDAEGAPLPQKLALPAACLGVTLINPYFLGLHLALIGGFTQTFVNLSYQGLSAFSQQFAGGLGNFVFYLSLVLAAGGLIAFKKRLPPAVTALTVITAFLAVITNQAMELYAILAFPFFSLSLAAIGRALTPVAAPVLTPLGSSGRAGLSAAVVLGLCLVTGILFTSNSYYLRTGHAAGFGLGAVEDIFPAEAAPVIEHPAFPPRALNTVMDGGYLAWRYPDRQVFIDPRLPVYGRDLYRQWRAGMIDIASEEWTGLLDTYNPQALILNANARNAPMTTRQLLETGEWRMAYFDGVTIILLPNAPVYDPIFEDAGLQNAGLQAIEQSRAFYAQAVESGRRPPVPVRLIGAGALFTTLQRYDQALDAYRPVVRLLPNLASAWYNLGLAYFHREQLENAARAFRQSAELLERNALGWLWLSRTYTLMDDRNAAERAFRQARNLNPDLAERLRTEWGLLEESD